VNIRDISILPTLEEIQSSRNEYLPLADPREWHIGGMEGLLDRQFRLLREDTVGQLRDAAKFELERLQSSGDSSSYNQRKRQGARTYVYHNVSISDFAFDPSVGMEVALSFDQPKEQALRDVRGRREWWEANKRMGWEAVICLLSSAGSAVFFVVSPERVATKHNVSQGVPLRKQYNLWSDYRRATVIAKPVNEDDIEPLFDTMLNSSTEQLSLVEFPGVLLPAFKPTLEAIQDMSETLDLPFAHILAPTLTPMEKDGETEVAPPEYATRPDFRYDLSTVCDTGKDLTLSPEDDLATSINKLAASSPLDQGQAQAVVSSLTRSFALVQGPPGTGKSYTGVQLVRILLANRHSASLGPIVTVFYTNHALDQTLERLLDEGVDHIIRIGGNSKSTRLQNVNLRVVTQGLELTKTEKSERWSLKRQVNERAIEVNTILSSMAQLGAQKSIEDLLQRHYPDHHAQLFTTVDEEGFRTVTYSPNSVIEGWLGGNMIPFSNVSSTSDHHDTHAASSDHRTQTVEELEDVNVFSMTRRERQLLHTHWIAEISEDLKHRLSVALRSYNDLKEKLDAIRTEQDLRVLKQAKIIGITTSGLARYTNLLRRIDAKVLICEEAGEVLESHLLTALLPSVQHAILIGDHQQLRPKVQNYDLSTESKNGAQYALDVSLFERLVRPLDVLAQPLPLSSLEVQRRMHPSIAYLVRQTQYVNLKDAPVVFGYPDVVGMKRRLFWMHHEYREDGDDGMVLTSHSNSYEVDMTAALVKHLIRQGVYKSNEIAVLTPYLGQLRKIRQKLSSSFEILLNERDVDDLQKEGDESDGPPGSREVHLRPTTARGALLQVLRVATVDNFQGEEAKVVIVSLVRSNLFNNPGFLRTPNRINVLLSRAQHGMYIIGNAKTTESVPMWSEVLKIFREHGNFGESLELSCPRHPHLPLIVHSPDDFVRLSPEAGCDLLCDKKLPCNHDCVSKCHSDMLHEAVQCTKPCTRPKAGCDHSCPLPCGAPCHKECQELVEDIEVELECGHTKTSLRCYEYQDLSKVHCDIPTERTVPGCLHQVTEPCQIDIHSDWYLCEAVCGEVLDCGHTCSEACHTCHTRKDGIVVQTEHGHRKCNQLCDQDYSTCNHKCEAPCHGQAPCPPCQAKCEVQCSHAMCDNLCSEPCEPCAERECGARCPHSGCTMPCAAPCDWVPCNLRCTKTLDCGCQCPSLCGERCPSAACCQTHASKEIKGMQVDMVTLDAYEDIDLDDDPCIVTACGHIFTVSTLDGLLAMKNHYKIDPKTYELTALKTASPSFSSDDLKSCPTCRGSLRNINRYGRLTRRALLDESMKRLTAWSSRMHQQLAHRLSEFQGRLLATLQSHRKPDQDIVLAGSEEDQGQAIKSLKTRLRYMQILDHRNSIMAFTNKLREDEMLFRRIHALMETSRRSKKNSGDSGPDGPTNKLHLREHVQATSLLLRAEMVILGDIMQIHEKTPASKGKGTLAVDFKSNRSRCQDLIEEAHATRSVRQEAEGLILWARFAAMECGRVIGARAEEIKTAGFSHLEQAEKICLRFADDADSDLTYGLKDEIEEVQKMLKEGLSTTEMKMFVQAMGREFSATGEWYICANGHPFNVDECGGEEKCPVCRAPIGGQE
jgi:hypothetical protein